MPLLCGKRADVFVPRATIGSAKLERVDVAALRRQLARKLVPGTVVGPAVAEDVEVASRCRCGADVLVPKAPVLQRPL